MRHQFSGELSSCGRGGRVGRGSSEQLFGCGFESRKAHALAERRGSRGARVCEMRQKTKDDRRLSAVRLNFCRRNRHRRHLDEQRERARRRPAVAGRAEPGLNRPRRRSRPGGPHGGRPADKEASFSHCKNSFSLSRICDAAVPRRPAGGRGLP